MRNPNGKIKIINAGEIPIPKYSLLNGCPRSEEPSIQLVDKHGE
jgi:hypothetical protein